MKQVEWTSEEDFLSRDVLLRKNLICRIGFAGIESELTALPTPSRSWTQGPHIVRQWFGTAGPVYLVLEAKSLIEGKFECVVTTATSNDVGAFEWYVLQELDAIGGVPSFRRILFLATERVSGVCQVMRLDRRGYWSMLYLGESVESGRALVRYLTSARFLGEFSTWKCEPISAWSVVRSRQGARHGLGMYPFREAAIECALIESRRESGPVFIERDNGVERHVVYVARDEEISCVCTRYEDELVMF